METTTSVNMEDMTYSIVERGRADSIQIEDEVQISSEDRSRLVRDLYEGPRECECCINWVEEAPAEADLLLPKEEEDSEDGPALVIRRRVIAGEKKKQVSLHSIEIRNKAVRKVLTDVFLALDNVVPGIKYLIFMAPFWQFFWHWERFEAAIEAQEEGDVKAVLVQLRTIVKKELAEAFSVSKELVKSGFINYKFLWTIFPPAELLYSDDDGSDRFFMLTGTSLSYHYTHNCKYVDWDGTRHGWASRRFTTRSFTGTRKITELDVFPAKFLKKQDAARIKQKCIDRGLKFLEYCTISYKGYSPRDDDSDSDSDDDGQDTAGAATKARAADRRIILDAKNHPSPKGHLEYLCDQGLLRYFSGLISQSPIDSEPAGGHRPLQPEFSQNGNRRFAPPGYPAYNHHPHQPPFDIVPAGPPPPPGRRPGRRPGAGAYIDHGMPPPQPGVIVTPAKTRRLGKVKRRASFDSVSSYASSTVSDDDDKPVLNDIQLQCCPSRMSGFSLKEKGWRTFKIDRICDIEWNTQPFDSLVLPDGYKDLILSFVESQLKDGDDFDDVINGKGGGLVILLSGEPGVGKTLTAESVAEKIQAPLYKMELGELKDDGFDSDTSSRSGSRSPVRRKRHGVNDEDEIVTAFDLASKWKAVLLIDECDLYLEKRSDNTPLKRNRIVTRFLQELEYYPSLLFLTTNRERVLDPAIYSRIHLTINYPALNVESRRTIWKTFLDRETGSSVSSEELDIISAVDTDGRKIRNITKTARILAKRAGRGISFDDIKNVMRITEGVTI